jgi:hypothetical protein
MKSENIDYRKKLEIQIEVNEAATEFINSRLKKNPNLLPQNELDIHEGFIKGLKFALQLLDEE